MPLGNEKRRLSFYVKTYQVDTDIPVTFKCVKDQRTNDEKVLKIILIDERSENYMPFFHKA